MYEAVWKVPVVQGELLPDVCYRVAVDIYSVECCSSDKMPPLDRLHHPWVKGKSFSAASNIGKLDVTSGAFGSVFAHARASHNVNVCEQA